MISSGSVESEGKKCYWISIKFSRLLYFTLCYCANEFNDDIADSIKATKYYLISCKK